MSEQEPDRKEVIFPETPDETFVVEGYGAQVTVNVWHSPISKIKPVFKANVGSVPDDSQGDTREIREKKYKSLTYMATLIGFQALSQRIPSLKTNFVVGIGKIDDFTSDEPFELTIASFPNDAEIQEPAPETDIATALPEQKSAEPVIEINTEPILIESLKPGVIKTFKNPSELLLFESELATKIQSNGTWGQEQKWSIRASIGELLKKFTLQGNKFNGSIKDIRLVVMPNPAKNLLEANESGNEAEFIFNEKLPYKPSAKKIEAVKSGTIGFMVTINATSTKGIQATTECKIWYTKLSSRSTEDIGRFMTRPVVINEVNTNIESTNNNDPVKRRWPTSDDKSSRRATLR